MMFSVFLFLATLVLFLVLSFVQKDVGFRVLCPECLSVIPAMEQCTVVKEETVCSLFVSWFVLDPCQLFLIFHVDWDYLSRIFQTDVLAALMSSAEL